MNVVMSRSVNILIVEDEPTVRLGLGAALKQAGHRVDSAANGAEGLALFGPGHHDLVITDLLMPGGVGGLEVLQTVKSGAPETAVVVMTAFGTVKNAVEAMRQGAFDYITKPFDPEELLIIIEKFIALRHLEAENLRLREELGQVRRAGSILGNSPAMQRVRATIETVGPSEASVLIYGETGTGKEVVANALRELSPRKEQPFIKINCAAVPETLFESELFGYEKGAFTGAQQRRKGKIEAAQGGTLLFDEIGDMPLAMQAKLLRVLEERKVDRLGGHQGVSIDVRFLYATAKNLKKAVQTGTFREDLYYRINVLPLAMPPLRERREDIPLFTRYFLDEFSRRAGKSDLTIAPAALAALTGYGFPGNVRELKHALEMAVTLCPEGEITLRHLPPDIREASAVTLEQPAAGAVFLADQVRSLERELISKALEEAGGKKATAADKLGVCRRTLWKKMRDLGMPGGLVEEEE